MMDCKGFCQRRSFFYDTVPSFLDEANEIHENQFKRSRTSEIIINQDLSEQETEMLKISRHFLSERTQLGNSKVY